MIFFNKCVKVCQFTYHISIGCTSLFYSNRLRLNFVIFISGIWRQANSFQYSAPVSCDGFGRVKLGTSYVIATWSSGILTKTVFSQILIIENGIVSNVKYFNITFVVPVWRSKLLLLQLNSPTNQLLYMFEDNTLLRRRIILRLGRE